MSFSATESRPLAGALYLVAGATSASGTAAARALDDAGATVLAAGTDAGRLEGRVPFAAGRYVADLADPDAVAGLARRIHEEHGRLDGLVHLVGGWRGGRGLAGQSDEDWEFLLTHVVTTLRNTSRAFYEDLADSARGRLVIVSASAVEHPTASGANYVAAKAAAEAWVRAVAAGFRAAQSGRRQDPVPQRSAAVVLAIKAFTDAAARAAEPEKSFAGFTDVEDFGRELVRVASGDADGLNGARIDLTAAR
ncbi:SDR family NAD(P)-dependent oxidoreductase [Zafaria sp. Z1313]|uniref:SDR family NAD(P)-dependent oxidoreductase n=1 Tax=unclassified Zafaria TaxID=2828765 RepID=UPI002E7A1D72|nr:SDR family NAD(P)-dependent oxidoreductase [Zafaria sp. J156]MEE1620127.1 SDR family NAD(P)-dependent oxidoreductase [Zafaria sp. J156]